MYGHQPTVPVSFSDSWSPDAVTPSAFPFLELSESEFELVSEGVYSTGSSSYDSLSSPASCVQPPLNGQFALGPNEFLDPDYGPVKRAFGNGDLHQETNVRQHGRRSESPLSSESNFIIECMSKACPYSPEEKKERIERYRSKRSLRNFNKKIKYECRKTLADSRPRVRGRFAKNEDSDQVHEWNQKDGVENDQELEENEENWINLLDSFSASYINN